MCSSFPSHTHPGKEEVHRLTSCGVWGVGVGGGGRPPSKYRHRARASGSVGETKSAEVSMSRSYSRVFHGVRG